METPEVYESKKATRASACLSWTYMVTGGSKGSVFHPLLMQAVFSPGKWQSQGLNILWDSACLCLGGQLFAQTMLGTLR